VSGASEHRISATLFCDGHFRLIRGARQCDVREPRNAILYEVLAVFVWRCCRSALQIAPLVTMSSASRAVKPNCPTSDQFGFLVECAFELDA
jgi:hypothetical protein